MTTVSVDCQEDEEARSKETKKYAENFFLGGVVNHNYKIAPDHEKMVLFTTRGFSLLMKDQEEPMPLDVVSFSKEVVWDPTSQYFAFFGQTADGTAIYLVDTKSEPIKAEVAYEVKRGEGSLLGLEWSPWGDEIYFLQNVFRGSYIDRTIQRVNAVKGKAKPEVLVKVVENIDFFMPPVSWFEHGDGVQKGRKYQIVYGTSRGLFILDRDGKKPVNLTEAPAVNLRNLEWSPDGKKIIMYYDGGFNSRRFGDLKGVTLVHLNSGKKKGVEFENLYDGRGIHTLWFSRKGKWITWVKETGCWYRSPDDRGKKGIRVPNPKIKTESGKVVEITDKPIKGAIWNKDETRLAITAGNQVWIYNTETKETKLYHEFGQGLTHFCAEPIWVGDELLLTIVEDVRLSGRQAPRPEKSEAEQISARSREERIKAKQDFLKRRREKYRKRLEAEEKKKQDALAKAKEKLKEQEEAERKKADAEAKRRAKRKPKKPAPKKPAPKPVPKKEVKEPEKTPKKAPEGPAPKKTN